MFRQNLICMRPQPGGTGYSLVGRVLTELATGERRLLADAAELTATLTETFELNITELGEPLLHELWLRVAARHETLFGDTPVDEINFNA